MQKLPLESIKFPEVIDIRMEVFEKLSSPYRGKVFSRSF